MNHIPAQAYNDIPIRCRKCGIEHLSSTMIKGYCEKCVNQYPFKCAECYEPITEKEYNIRQGFCADCHIRWLKGDDNKRVLTVETYPGTGV